MAERKQGERKNIFCLMATFSSAVIVRQAVGLIMKRWDISREFELSFGVRYCSEQSHMIFELI